MFFSRSLWGNSALAAKMFLNCLGGGAGAPGETRMTHVSLLSRFFYRYI